jgi:hypothetical protein
VRNTWTEPFAIELRACPGLLRLCTGALAVACAGLIFALILRSRSENFHFPEFAFIVATAFSIWASALSIHRYSRLVVAIRVADTVDCEISGKKVEISPYFTRVGSYQCLHFRDISVTAGEVETASAKHHRGEPRAMVIGNGSASPHGLKRLNRWLEWRASLIDD